MAADVWTGRPASSPSFPLQALPDELLDLVLEGLPRPDLCSVSVSSRWGYSRAAAYIWRE
ncbi:MAG: F-box protein, partial [Terriglobus roseus]|nr:F-box protein [Terriglobus roseus]